MKLIQLPRRGGKTTYAIDWLRAGDKRVLIVPNTAMKRVLQDAHADLAHRILAASQISRAGLPVGYDYEVGIDELDLVVTELLGHGVKFATRTPHEVDVELAR